jgi:hypothetical protein
VCYCLEWSDQNFRKAKDQPTRRHWTFPGDAENWAYTKYFELTLILMVQCNYKHKMKRKKLICLINIIKVCYFSTDWPTDWLTDWLIDYLTPCNRDLSEKLTVSQLEEKYNLNIGNKSFERVEYFRCLGATLTNQNSIHEEIKSRSKSRNACYHSLQNPLSSSFISTNINVKIYRTFILPLFLYGCKAWSLTLREEHRLRVFENYGAEDDISA